MRVMHLRTVVGAGGGPEKTILNSPRFLPEDEVTLVYIRPSHDPEFDLVERAAEVGASLIDIPEAHGLDPRTLLRLRQEVKKFRPDVLHPHDYKTNLLAWLCRPRSALLVTTVHGYVSRGGKLEIYYWLDQFALRRMDHVIAVSDDIEAHVQQMGVDPSKVSTIDNGIDELSFQRAQSTEQAKRQLGFHPQRILIGGVGRLAAEKGFDLLIAVTAQLADAGFDVELAIVGEGDQREPLSAQIAATRHADRIHLLGWRSDTKELYEAMDVFVLSSLREGLPNVVLEAMAMEVPVVATNIAGVPKLIRDGENGLLVAAGSEAELQQAITELLEHPARRAALAKQARQTIIAEFSFASRMQKIRTIYQHVQASARPAS